MEQDLFSWLNSQKKSQEADLLVAPLSVGTQDNAPNLNEDMLPQDSGNGRHIADSESEYGYLTAYVRNELAGKKVKDTESSQHEPPENLGNESGVNFSDIQSESGLEDLNIYTPNETSKSQNLGNESATNFSGIQNESGHEDLSIYTPNETSENQNLRNESGVNFSGIQNETGHDDLNIYTPNETSENQFSGNEAAINFSGIQSESGNEDLSIYTPNYTSENQVTDSEYEDSPISYSDEYAEDDPIHQDHDWQERATGFTLSLDEPPPELWMHINDDDPDPEYEPTDSLQGAAYVQIHGRNFTERLHHTLKHRKERAEERAQAEGDNNSSKPLMQMAVILCATLVMIFGVACLALWFVGRETPEGMKRRGESLLEAGNFEEAEEVYRRAHRRYPERNEFLAGLSEASEKAGHHQTAKAARDEYENKISVPESKDKSPKPENPPEIKTPQTSRNIIPQEKPKTFTDYLNEGNYAYNIGMYNRAVINFFRAMSINSRDIRPYLGLSASYRMKGMYFDSNRILEEARRIFGRSPAVDMGLYFLREAK